jgi:iron complex outermembrane receptor protein
LLSIQADSTSGVGDLQLNGPYGTSGPAGIAAPGPTPSVPYGQARGWPMRASTDTALKETRYRWQFSQALHGDLQLTLLGGYDTTAYHHALDGTAFPAATSIAKQFITDQNPDTQNEELRLSNAPESRLFWQVGGFYFNESNPLTPHFLTVEGPYSGQDTIAFNYSMHSISKAGFAHMAFKFNDAWKGSAGIRYTQDHKYRTGVAKFNLTVATDGFLMFDPSRLPGNPVVPRFLCSPACISVPTQITPDNGDVTTSRVTYHLGLDWTPGEGRLVYAKYDTGYKAGGFNTNGQSASVNYDPEVVNSFEVGTKNRLLHNRLEANLSLFHMRYEGYQANQFTAAIGGGQGIFNAGNAIIYGAEGELAWLPHPLTRLNISSTLLHAAFRGGCAGDASVTYLPGAPSCGSPLDGSYLPNAPRVSVTTGIEQGWRTQGGGIWTARLQGKYQSKFYFDIFNHEDLTQRSYVLGDLSVAYAPAESAWNVEAYVRNIANAAVIDSATRNNLIAANTYQFHAPRLVGLRVGAKF